MKEETITLPSSGVDALVTLLRMTETLLGSVDVVGEDSDKRDHCRRVAASLALEIEVQR